MDQSRAINALAPFIALAKSANSPRAAADLVTQATSAANTYVLSELLQQPNVQALAGHEQYGNFHTLLQCFAWGTWESYKSTAGLPQLSDAQALKLRFLSLLTIASEKASSSNLSYASLCSRLDLESPIDLEHLITQAIYNDLITGTLNPASQTVIITSVAPLRDPAPGSVQAMIAELNAWSGRCDTVLSNLEEQITKVKSEAEKRARREQKADKQIRAVTEEGGKGAAGGSGGTLAPSKLGLNTRGATKREQADDDDDEDMMDLDEPSRNAGGGRKKSSGSQGMLGRFKR